MNKSLYITATHTLAVVFASNYGETDHLYSGLWVQEPKSLVFLFFKFYLEPLY